MTDQALGAPPPLRPIVLVVDDVSANLRVISAMVGAMGVDVRVADNGPLALELARQAPLPDLVLLDVMMPKMDGHAVLAELRASSLTSHIPVIFVTAMDNPNDEEIGLLEGAADYITKPINPAVLKARVQAQLELKQAHDQQARQQAWLEQEVANRIAENNELESRLELTLSAAGFGIWEHQHLSGRNKWNERLCQMLGRRTAPPTIAESLALIHPEDRSAVEQCLAAALGADNDGYIGEYRMCHQDGHWLWVEGRGRIIERDQQGQPLLTLGTVTDISRRKAAEAEHRLSSVVFTGINDGICITDTDGRILLTNDAFSKVTGYSAAEAKGQNPSLLKSGVHGAPFFREMWETLNRHDNWQGEITNRRKDGELVCEWLSISAVRDSAGQLTHYVGLFSDLSERKAASERIQYLSSFDPLTDLPNRNLFADRLGQALMSGRRFERQTAIILLDLNRFHLVNDTLGPPAGDEVLIEIARRLNLQVREGDTVGRCSGNEFGFIMANLGHEHDVIALVQRMQEAISVPVEVAGQSLVVSASIGISLAPRDGDNAEALLKTANTALAMAKKAGRHAIRFYSAEMNADATRRLGLESALREALQRNELEVVYQPQVSLETGNIIGMEALMRWNSPQFGAIPPSEFIPIAEETGLILPLGEWILRTACQQTRQWLDLGLANLRVAVNISTRQFRQSTLEHIIKQALADSRLPASALELEITESAFIDDVDDAVAVCHALKAIGVKLSLDDFGTGYSSLSYVSRFPFDKIKIDQGFVRDIVENPINAAIASATIVMARSLNLSALAEGVETEAQASFLRSRRCDAIQGFLFSRPLPPAEFEQLLASNKRLTMADLPGSQRPTLLIVDDEPNICNALNRLLHHEGFQIITATSPAEAFDHLAKQPIQVILSDQRMPEMSGTDFFARVRQLYPETIRLILTGYTDLESVTDAINRGAIYKFLTKPWDDDQLREQIRQAFRLAKEVQHQMVNGHD